MLTYKILEHSGYGTETLFIYEDLKNFYICTKDIASYSDVHLVRDYPSFLTNNKSKFTPKDNYPSQEEE